MLSVPFVHRFVLVFLLSVMSLGCGSRGAKTETKASVVASPAKSKGAVVQKKPQAKVKAESPVAAVTAEIITS